MADNSEQNSAIQILEANVASLQLPASLSVPLSLSLPRFQEPDGHSSGLIHLAKHK